MRHYYIFLTACILSGCNGYIADANDASQTSTDIATPEHHSHGENENHTHDSIDITNKILENRATNCAEYANTYTSDVLDIQRDLDFEGNLEIVLENGKCLFNTNSIPNHNFNDGGAHFATAVSEVNKTFKVTQTPTPAASTTPLSLRTDNAIFLNGVKLDLLAAGCFGIGDGRIGCHKINAPFRYDPMSPASSFGTDSHNAHTQPDGTYHYHGNPNALFHSDQAIESPIVGFAADGYPIYGSYFDDNGTVRKAASSYQLKSGTRVAQNGINPGGSYDGTYIDDYEYVKSLGDLDECNGMTINGSYGYYITDAYPWVLKCFKGTPDASFNKR